MRIAHTCLRYPPATGGVETYVKEIVERTKSTGIDTRVLTSRMRTHGPITELEPDQLLDDPPYVQRLFPAKTPGISYPRLQSLNYYLNHHNPDIIHGYSFWYQPADTAARYAKKKKKPYILHPIYYDNKIRQKPIWQIYKKTYGKTTFAAADVVAVISPFEQKLIEEAGFPVKRFELIPPGIEIEKFAKKQENIFQKNNISGNILLTVSRLAAGKGIDEVITAMSDILKQHPETHLVIVGEDFGEQKNLEKQTKKLGLEKNIHFLGKLSDQELISTYQHADIFIHPSHYEAFGIVLGESLAANTPVVARNGSAIPFVAPHKKAGLLFSSPEELIKGVNTLLSNPELRQSYASQGKHHIQQNFSWDTTIKKILNIYDELL